MHPIQVAIDIQAVHGTTTGGTNALIQATNSVGTFRTQRKAMKASKTTTKIAPPPEKSSTVTPITTPTMTKATTPTPIVGQASAIVVSSTGSRVSSLNTFQTEITTQMTEQLSNFRSDMMSIMREMMALQAGATQIQACSCSESSKSRGLGSVGQLHSPKTFRHHPDHVPERTEFAVLQRTSEE